MYDVGEEEKRLNYHNDALSRDGANLRTKINSINNTNDINELDGDTAKQREKSTTCYVPNDMGAFDTQVDREITSIRCIPSPPGAFIVKSGLV
jgi:hypothetical protein